MLPIKNGLVPIVSSPSGRMDCWSAC